MHAMFCWWQQERKLDVFFFAKKAQDVHQGEVPYSWGIIHNLLGGLGLQCWGLGSGSTWWLRGVASCCFLGRYHRPRTPWIWHHHVRKHSHLLVMLWILWTWVCPQGMNSTCSQLVSGRRCSSLASKNVLWSSQAWFESLVAAPYRCPSQLELVDTP